MPRLICGLLQHACDLLQGARCRRLFRVLYPFYNNDLMINRCRGAANRQAPRSWLLLVDYDLSSSDHSKFHNLSVYELDDNLLCLFLSCKSHFNHSHLIYV